MRLQLLLGIFLLGFIFVAQVDSVMVCTPKLAFKNCKATKDETNLMWNMQHDTSIIFDLDLIPNCRNSKVKIQWKLFELGSGDLIDDWPHFGNKLRAVVTATDLRMAEYVVSAAARETAMHKTTGTSTAECWFRITGKRSAFAGVGASLDLRAYSRSAVRCLRNCREANGRDFEVQANPMTHMILEYHIGSYEQKDPSFLTSTFNWQERHQTDTTKLEGMKLRNRLVKRTVYNIKEDTPTFYFGKSMTYRICIENSKAQCTRGTIFEQTVDVADIGSRDGNKRKDDLDFLKEGTVWKDMFKVVRVQVTFKYPTRQRMYITYQFSGHSVAYLALHFTEAEAKETTYYLVGVKNAKVEFQDFLPCGLNFMHWNKADEDPPYPYEYKLVPYIPKDGTFVGRLKFVKELYALTSNKYKKLLIPGGPKKLLSSGKIPEAMDMIHTLMFILNCDNSLPDADVEMSTYYDFLADAYDDLTEISSGITKLGLELKANMVNLYHLMQIAATLPRFKIPDGIERQMFIAKKRLLLVVEVLRAITELFTQIVEQEGGRAAVERPMRYNQLYMTTFYNPLLLTLADVLGKNFVMPPIFFEQPSSSINPHQKVVPENYPDYGEHLDDSTRAECAEITSVVTDYFIQFGRTMCIFLPLGETDIRNHTKYTEIYHFVEENLRMVLSLDFVVGEVKFTMQPLAHIDIYDWETIGLIVAVKPSAYFFANIRPTFPIVAQYIYIRFQPNYGYIHFGGLYERPTHISFTYKDAVVKSQHHSFSGLGSEPEGWTVGQINSNMILLRCEVPQDVLLMISVKNYSGFSNATNDRVMVSLVETKYPKFPDHFKKNASDTKLLLVFTENNPVQFHTHKDTPRFLYLAIVPTNAPFVDTVTEPPAADTGGHDNPFATKQLLQFDEYQDEKPAEGGAAEGGEGGEAGGEEGEGGGGASGVLAFDMAVAVYKCLSWDSEEKIFNNTEDCQIPQGALDPNTIKCACIRSGIVLPEVRSIRALTLNSTRIHLELQFQVNWVVFTCTFVAFFLYCLLLLFAAARLKPVLNLCYLGDNVKADRTAYLIVVRTKDVPEAGTTSNVMMKVHGRSTNSKSFVLNYPDPDRRLLQMAGEDAFVLTTEEHLGRIRYVEIWVDVIGFRPGCPKNLFTYYRLLSGSLVMNSLIKNCETILIYDLRRNKEYYFDVQEQFTLREDEKCYKKIAATTSQTRRVTPKHPFDYLVTHFGPLHTFNILDSSRDFELHYMCRITLILSHVIICLAVTLFMVANPSMNLRDSLGFDPFTSFRVFVTFICIVAAAANIPNFLISIVFRNSSYYGLLRYRIGCVPGFITVIAWVVLVLMISCGMIYLLLCGWWLAAIVIPGFLVISALALLVDIFLFEYLLISIYNFATMKTRFSTVNIFKEYDLVNVVLEAEQQRRFLYRRVSIWGMRPFFKHLYKPLKDDIMKERRYINQSRYNIRRNLGDVKLLWFLGLCVLLLYIVRHEPHAAVMNKHLEDLFVYGICSHCTNKTDISDNHKTIFEVWALEDIYKYLNYTVAFVTMNTTWYDGYIATDPGMMIDFQTKVIGVTRVRQVRVGPDECPDEEMSKDVGVEECLPAFDSNTSLKLDEKGKSMHAYQTYDGYSFMPGQMVDNYDGSGYWIKLGRKYRNAVFTVTLIQNAVWFTLGTRAVFVELWTYNANTGLFSDVRILFERGPMQYIQASYRIKSVELGFYDPVLEVVTVALLILTIFLAYCFAMEVLKRLFEYRYLFFTSLWRLMDVAILVLCIFTLVTYISKEFAEIGVMNEMVDTRRNDFVSYFPVFHYVDTMQLVVGLLVFFCLVRVMEIIKFTNSFRINQMVFRAAYMECAFVFGVMLVAFFGLSLAAVVKLADHPMTSGSFWYIMVSHFRIMCGFYNEFSIWIMRESDGLAMYWYYAALSAKVLTLFFMCNMTCLRVYKETKRKLSGQQWTYTLMDYAKEFTYYFTQYCRRSVAKPVYTGLRGGGAEWYERPIMAKEDKYRYEKVKKLAGTKVNLMRLCLLATVRNTVVRRGTKLTSHDYNIMQELSKAVYAKRHPWYARSGALDDPTHTFYFLVRERGEERMKARLVNDTVIEKMEMTSAHFTTTSIFEQKKSIAESTQIMVPDLLSLGRLETILRSLVALDLLFENISVDIDEIYGRESSQSNVDVQDEVSEESGDEYDDDAEEESEKEISDDWPTTKRT